ncbi:MAG: hypothetical protein R3E88_15935 [Myxococcota bacterium]
MSAVAAPGAVVTAVGAVTPVGCGVVETGASIRAGIARLRVHPSYVPIQPEIPDGEPEPVRAAWVLDPGLGVGLRERLARLALAALADLAATSGLRRDECEGLPVAWALPERGRDGIADVDAADLARDVAARSGLALAFAGACEDGHAAAHAALARALEQLAGGAPRCLVVAVDSQLDEDVLASLDAAYRLRSARNVDGYIPGEAAVALLVERADAARARGAHAPVAIRGVARGDEPSSSRSDAASTGAGLAEACRAALAGAALERARWVVCDLNGESHRAHEWGTVSTRLAAELASPAVWHPADCAGDVGAASGALGVALVARAHARGYAPARDALVWCASEGAARAAAIVGANEEAGPWARP